MRLETPGFGARGESSQTDSLFARLHRQGKQTSVLLHYSARRLQLHTSFEQCDHMPVQLNLQMPTALLRSPEADRQIISEAMSATLQR